MDDVKIISYFGYVIHLINIVLYLTTFRKHNKSYKTIAIYLVYIGFVQFATERYASQGMNNHHMATYYMFGQFIFLGLFFYYLFKPFNVRAANIIKYSSIVISIGLISQYVISPSLYFTFNPIGFFITNIALIIYAVIYLYELLTMKSYFYYTVIGILIYLMSSSFIFSAAASIITLKDDMSFLIWKINGILFILYQLLLLWEWKQNYSPKAVKQG